MAIVSCSVSPAVCVSWVAEVQVPGGSDNASPVGGRGKSPLGGLRTSRSLCRRAPERGQCAHVERAVSSDGDSVSTGANSLQHRSLDVCREGLR